MRNILSTSGATTQEDCDDNDNDSNNNESNDDNDNNNNKNKIHQHELTRKFNKSKSETKWGNTRRLMKK